MIDPDFLEPGSTVAYTDHGPGRDHYQFVRRGCATEADPCGNAPWSVVVYLLRGGVTRGLTQCLNAMELEVIHP